MTFVSGSTNLVEGDTNSQYDIFIHDRQTRITERVSIASDGSQANNRSYNSSISEDGRFVAFSSKATNLVEGDTNSITDIFVHDRQTGITERVSIASDGSQANDYSYGQAISGDGRFVTFSSKATNLVEGDTNSVEDIFVHDRQTGITERVSIASDGSQANDYSYGQAISGDGRFVTFSSEATNLVEGDTNSRADIFVHDRQTGITERLNIGYNGSTSNKSCEYLSISGDGRFVAYFSNATNLVEGDTNSRGDVFISPNRIIANCEFDSDLDSVFGEDDNCPNTYNPDQLDSNNDGFGDACYSESISPITIDGVESWSDGLVSSKQYVVPDGENRILVVAFAKTYSWFSGIIGGYASFDSARFYVNGVPMTVGAMTTHGWKIQLASGIFYLENPPIGEITISWDALPSNKGDGGFIAMTLFNCDLNNPISISTNSGPNITTIERNVFLLDAAEIQLLPPPDENSAMPVESQTKLIGTPFAGGISWSENNAYLVSSFKFVGKPYKYPMTWIGDGSYRSCIVGFRAKND